MPKLKVRKAAKNVINLLQANDSLDVKPLKVIF